MAVAKRKSKGVQKDVAHMSAHMCTCQPSPIHKHLFLGGAITLLLVLATAQFALSRITWEEVHALQQEPEEVVVPAVSVKEPTYVFTTDSFSGEFPASFDITAYNDGQYVVHQISQSDAEMNAVLIYPSVYTSQEEGLRPQAAIVAQARGGILRKTEYAVVPGGVSFTIEYWSAPDVSQEALSQLEHAMQAIEWNKNSDV